MNTTIFISVTANGYFATYKSRFIYSRNIFSNLELCFKNPTLWVWLFEHNMLDSPDVPHSFEPACGSIIVHAKEYSEEKLFVNAFETEGAFIPALIDKLDELCPDSSLDDTMLLSRLEELCHERGINLLDFFYFLESDKTLEKNDEYEEVDTNVFIYYGALSVLLESKHISMKSFSSSLNMDYPNLITEKSDSRKGKRKTIRISTLFSYTHALGISITEFMQLCNFLLGNRT